MTTKRRVHGLGWGYWSFVGAGSSGKTLSHYLVLLDDDTVIKLCDRHQITVEQGSKLRNGMSPKGVCRQCNRIMMDIARKSASLSQLVAAKS